MTGPPILIIDDDPESFADEFVSLLIRRKVPAEVVLPHELARAHIDAASLILVDYKLEHWTGSRDSAERDRPPHEQLIACRPNDGLALAGVVRSQLGQDRPAGVALLSGNLDELGGDFTPAVTEHATARINGLEWAFDKRPIQGLPTLDDRVMHFARGVLQIHGVFQDLERESSLFGLLSLPDAEWRPVAERDIYAALPPINQLATATHGLSVLRWLAQRILPYPTFLLDQARLAVAFGIDPTKFVEIEIDALEPAFGAVQYRGPLAQFLGPRWWRAGVRRFVREATGSSDPGADIAEVVNERLGLKLPALDPPSAVLSVDQHLQTAASPVPRERAFRVHPDDWPPFAETGWMSEELLRKNPDLQDLVDPAERDRLESSD